VCLGVAQQGDGPWVDRRQHGAAHLEGLGDGEVSLLGYEDTVAVDNVHGAREKVHARERCDVAGTGHAPDGVGVSLLHHPAALHHDDAIGQHHGFQWLVRHHELHPVKGSQRGAYLAAGVGSTLDVECGKGLIEQEQIRFQRQRPRQRHALGLPTGKLARPPGAEVRDPEALQQLERASPCRVSLDTVGHKSEGDVVEHGK
jgi:hypothetical protein